MRRRVLGEEHPDTLTSAGNLASSLSDQGKHAEAEEMLRAALAVCRRVLGSAHPDTLATAESLASVQSQMRATQPTKRGGKPPARRKECAAASLLSATALAEAEVKASAAEVELLAMLELEEAGAGDGSGSAKGKAKGKASDRRLKVRRIVC